MITVTIDDPELERVYHTFNDNDEEFSKYLALTTSANNVEYGWTPEELEAAYDEAGDDESDSIEHHELFAKLREKYDIDKV